MDEQVQALINRIMRAEGGRQPHDHTVDQETLDEAMRRGFVRRDPEWSGCLNVTEAGLDFIDPE